MLRYFVEEICLSNTKISSFGRIRRVRVVINGLPLDIRIQFGSRRNRLHGDE